MATELFGEFWQWRLKDSPEFATMVGFHGYDHLLESYSIKSFQDRKEKVQYFLKKAKQLLPKLEDQWSQASLNILIDGLDGYLRGLDTDGKFLKQDAVKVIETSVLPAFSKLRKFIKEEYMLHLRPEIAATSLPSGEAYYKECLRYHLELDLTPQEVHQLGLDEVKRISDNMKQIIKSLGSSASPKEFSEMIRNDSSFLCKSSDDVVKMYEKLLDEEINPKLLTIFPSVPKSPLRIQLQDASKSGGPGAMYIQGTADFSRPGIFYVNAADLTRSPKYLMPALALHEGNPGHHLQGSYAMELPGMPSFRSQIEDRRYNDGPVHFPLHTAYVEGWGLYSEYLGYELGVYKTLHEKYGHLTQEMLRACRLVVDTGMHALGWSRERAVQYLLEHTSSSQGEVESEIDRYITWPGQASIMEYSNPITLPQCSLFSN
ncbi:hypothetical protein HPB50_006023 [Hyalomma asiaticum]|uniref:Uncharacterized protein n=1 Tax=Hyalomma asiaticum TaxID=266040 RepID=A0ACB7TJ66_HYAAI|nr:hypothetical protein HPB50_006023 [Hyalomma asiaticum]